MDDLKSWGFNMVRLGVMWEAVETAPGYYRHQYLDEVEKLVNKLGENGIYTLIDMHQDVLARPICGEGMPDFYADMVLKDKVYCVDETFDWIIRPIANAMGYCKSMDDYGFRKDEKGWPLLEDCAQNNFFDYYSSIEAISLFRALYYNIHGMQDKFVAYWNVLGERFGKNPNVIGFDPINEPFRSWNSIRELKRTNLDGKTSQDLLTPLYKRVFEKLRGSSDSSVMWFEPPLVD